jgi:hypothetical protein
VKTLMTTRRLFACVTLLLATAFAGSGLAGEARQDSLDGVYRLVSRRMNDGTTLYPPDVIGWSTRLNGHRHTEILSKKPNGNYVLVVFVVDYEATDTEYREKNVMTVFYDPDSGRPAAYDAEGRTSTSPITRTDGRMEFKLPDNPKFPDPRGARIVAEKGRYLATLPNFVDTWEKVE